MLGNGAGFSVAATNLRPRQSPDPAPSRTSAHDPAVSIHVDPVGNDPWVFGFLLELTFSDGSHMNASQNDIELSDDRQEQSFGLAPVADARQSIASSA
jgi:hypothetical protein